jgi:hypothetical protein
MEAPEEFLLHPSERQKKPGWRVIPTIAGIRFSGMSRNPAPGAAVAQKVSCDAVAACEKDDGNDQAVSQKRIRPEANLTAGCVDRRLRSAPGYLR